MPEHRSNNDQATAVSAAEGIRVVPITDRDVHARRSSCMRS